jgi:exodeoxyribonuclease VII small subunit
LSETTFKEAYGVLQKHSEALRQAREPNIDELLTVVEESVEAYKICKDRIAAVEAALERALGDVGAEGSGQQAQAADQQRS